MGNLEEGNTSDEQWAERAQAGSMPAFEKLLIRYESRIYRFLFMKVGNAEEAEDLTQDVFIAAYRNLRRYRSKYSFATWIFTIARRKSISYYRKKQTRARHDPVLLEEPTDPADPRERVEDREIRQNIWTQIRECVTQDQYTALWMTYQENLTVAETAKVMRKTVPGVKLLLYRGRRRLYDHLPPGLSELRGKRSASAHGSGSSSETREKRSAEPTAMSCEHGYRMLDFDSERVLFKI
jgi:RNA polymerase sigma-70 factor (ECF subfamily)